MSIEKSEQVKLLEENQVLLVQAKRLRALVDAAQDFLYMVDLEKRLLFVNKAGAKKFKALPEKLFGKALQELFPPETAARQSANIDLVVKTGKPLYVEYPYSFPGGTVWLNARLFPVFDDQERVYAVVGTSLDITERKLAEEKIQQAHQELERKVFERTQELEAVNRNLIQAIEEQKRAESERLQLEKQILHRQKLESLGLMAGGIAHDFNNLLMGVLANAELILDRLHPNPEIQEVVQYINTAALRLADLTGQMLAYAGRTQPQKHRIHLSEEVEKIVPLLKTAIPKKVCLDLALGPELPSMVGDVDQIRQVILNLITNAAEAIEGPTGTVTVTTGSAEVSSSRFSTALFSGECPDGAYVFLEVQDNGCGMEREMLRQIFDPFFTTKSNGRGLGLSVVVGIVRSHKGAIEVESEPNQGSKFRVWLPLTKKEPIPITVQPPTLLEDISPCSILVVDDEPIVRSVAQSILEKSGCRVVLASDGIVAVDLFQKIHHTLDLVLLDLTMPGQDGLTTMEKLRKIRNDIPIVLTSGYPESDLEPRTVENRPNAFLQKPYNNKELNRKIREVLQPLKKIQQKT